MLDTAAMPAGKREEETDHNRIFREFMAGYHLAPLHPLFSYPPFFCPAGTSLL
jgi:hypothetical protein